MGFFDFYAAKDPGQHRRLDLRHDLIVTPYAADLAGARVLDLAAHDGRWSLALAAAGAREVVGVEGRAELVAEFDTFPDLPGRDRVRLVVGDIFDELRAMVGRGERFDVVALYGIYYHVMDHYLLLRLVDALGPRLVVVDSEFATSPAAVIAVTLEDPDKPLNSLAQVPGQERTPIGIPSRRAMELMAGSLGYDVTWSDPTTVPEASRRYLKDYFRDASAPKRRGTCALRRRDQGPQQVPTTGV